MDLALHETIPLEIAQRAGRHPLGNITNFPLQFTIAFRPTRQNIQHRHYPLICYQFQGLAQVGLGIQIYFAGANAAFLGRTIELPQIGDAIQTWATWHWLRTGLAIVAGGFASWGLFVQVKTEASP
jgi:hypothetical protein